MDSHMRLLQGICCCQILNRLEGDELVSVLCRNSGIPCGMPALASPDDTSGATDNCPVLLQRGRTTSEPGASYQERFTQAWILAWNPSVPLERSHAGELSLSTSVECLSLHAQDSTHVQNVQEDGFPGFRCLSFLPPTSTEAGIQKGFLVKSKV